MKLIKKIRTKDGDAQIDYKSLANLPFIPIVDDTLSISGEAADAKITGEKISELHSIIENLIQLLQNNNVIE